LRTDHKMLSNSLWKKVWVTVRFVLFGVFGFIVMFGAWVAVLDRFTSVRHESGEMSPFLLVLLSLIGAVMMLFGVGEWGRWGYLLRSDLNRAKLRVNRTFPRSWRNRPYTPEAATSCSPARTVSLMPAPLASYAFSRVPRAPLP
jgi:hypothetical protein